MAAGTHNGYKLGFYIMLDALCGGILIFAEPHGLCSFNEPCTSSLYIIRVCYY